MNKENKVTRRQVVSGLRTALAGVAVSLALAASGADTYKAFVSFL